MRQEYNRKGYLKEDFKVFYLSDTQLKDVPFHYHDFMKILVLLNGNVSYVIEGKQYELHPFDIVLVDAGEIHRPIVQNGSEYERVIIYISKLFMDRYRDYDLHMCFRESKKCGASVIRQYSPGKQSLSLTAVAMTEPSCQTGYAGELLQRCRLIEFMVLLNQAVAESDTGYITPFNQNPVITEVIQYINNNITEKISIDDIAHAVHLNRSYLMHKFKAETGYTMKEYITEKRIFLANKYMQSQVSITEACYKSGFSNYSSFYRAYAEKYGCSPRQRNEVGKMNLVEPLE